MVISKRQRRNTASLSGSLIYFASTGNASYWWQTRGHWEERVVRRSLSRLSSPRRPSHERGTFGNEEGKFTHMFVREREPTFNCTLPPKSKKRLGGGCAKRRLEKRSRIQVESFWQKKCNWPEIIAFNTSSHASCSLQFESELTHGHSSSPMNILYIKIEKLRIKS